MICLPENIFSLFPGYAFTRRKDKAMRLGARDGETLYLLSSSLDINNIRGSDVSSSSVNKECVFKYEGMNIPRTDVTLRPTKGATIPAAEKWKWRR